MQFITPDGHVFTPHRWIARLNQIAEDRAMRMDRRAECALLGHQLSGEFYCTNPPLHVCWWCAEEFHRSYKRRIVAP